jgi:hypothetical protein
MILYENRKKSCHEAEPRFRFDKAGRARKIKARGRASSQLCIIFEAYMKKWSSYVKRFLQTSTIFAKSLVELDVLENGHRVGCRRLK